MVERGNGKLGNEESEANSSQTDTTLTTTFDTMEGEIIRPQPSQAFDVLDGTYVHILLICRMIVVHMIFITVQKQIVIYISVNLFRIVCWPFLNSTFLLKVRRF